MGQDGALHDSCRHQVVEYIRAVLPWVRVSVLAHAFIVEAVLDGDVSRFVIPAEDCDAAWVFQLEAKQQLEDLERVLATVDEVTHEHVVSVRDLTARLE